MKIPMVFIPTTRERHIAHQSSAAAPPRGSFVERRLHDQTPTATCLRLRWSFASRFRSDQSLDAEGPGRGRGSSSVPAYVQQQQQQQLGPVMGEVILPRRLFLWCMSAIYLSAFVSLYVQIPGEHHVSMLAVGELWNVVGKTPSGTFPPVC